MNAHSLPPHFQLRHANFTVQCACGQSADASTGEVDDAFISKHADCRILHKAGKVHVQRDPDGDAQVFVSLGDKAHDPDFKRILLTFSRHQDDAWHVAMLREAADHLEARAGRRVRHGENLFEWI